MATIDVSWSRRPDGGAIDLEVLKRKSWEGVTAYFVKIAAPVTYDFKLKSNSNYISLHDFYRVDGETRVSGLARGTAKDLRNKIAFIPAGCDISGWTKIDKPATIVIVMIDDRKSGRQRIKLSDLPPRIDFDDPMLRSLLLRFQSILDDPSLDTPGYAETLAELASYEVLRARPRGDAPKAAKAA
jgi:AraC family transcriptional regulator